MNNGVEIRGGSASRELNIASVLNLPRIDATDINNLHLLRYRHQDQVERDKGC